MNYNDEILTNKMFNFVKKLLYNIIIAICVLLLVALILVYGFKFRPYQVLSNSMSPVFTDKDIVVVKAQKQYKVGDVIKYDLVGGFPVSHRLIAIVNNNGTTYYVTHGDALDHLDGNKNVPLSQWQYDVDLAKDKTYSELKDMNAELDFLSASQIEGKVVTVLHNWGRYLNFISEHKFMFVAFVISIWCVLVTVQNEIEINKDRRLMHQWK